MKTQTPEHGFPIHEQPRVVILANHKKPQVVDALKTFRHWLEERAQVITELDAHEINHVDIHSLREAHFGLVLGGDGTMLSQGRRLVECELPLVGVNFGKLGFLAEFSLEEVKTHWDHIVAGQCHISRRLLVEVLVLPTDAPKWGGEDPNNPQLPTPVFQSVAMNEAVITNGPSNRLVEISLAIDPRHTQSDAAIFSGDGVIVSTPSGSTAYNLAAGGPIVSPDVEGFCVTAICPQSMAARPIVTHADNEIWLAVQSDDEGAALIVDGQERYALAMGQQVLIRRYPKKLRLVHNPTLNYWMTLSHKMRWAVRPQLHNA